MTSGESTTRNLPRDKSSYPGSLNGIIPNLLLPKLGSLSVNSTTCSMKIEPREVNASRANNTDIVVELLAKCHREVTVHLGSFERFIDKLFKGGITVKERVLAKASVLRCSPWRLCWIRHFDINPDKMVVRCTPFTNVGRLTNPCPHHFNPCGWQDVIDPKPKL